MNPLWRGDMDPTLAQIIQHMVNADADRARLQEENKMLREQVDELRQQLEGEQ